MFPYVLPTDTPDPQLAATFRGFREEKGLTQEDVAYAAGMTVSSYAEIDRGASNPAWTTIRRIADALDVSLVELAEAVEGTESA